MANISISKIDVVVPGYSRNYTDNMLILHLVICFTTGDVEGVISIYDDTMSDDGCTTIAQQCKSEDSPQPIRRILPDCLDMLKYFYAEYPNRRQFCAHPRIRIKYNCTVGYLSKEYQCIKNQITEGLEHKTNDIAAAIALHDVTDLRYPSGLHLNLFTDQSRHEQLLQLLADTDWFSVQQISNVKRNGKYSSIMIMFCAEMLVDECKKSFQRFPSPLIPVIIEMNNSKWIEWVKIVKIGSNGLYVGDIAISFKYNELDETWMVQSIYLDPHDINCKHQLSGMRRDKYNNQLSNFKTNISKIVFTDDSNK